LSFDTRTEIKETIIRNSTKKNIFRYDALVFIDECHATGFFGKTGRGTEEFFEMVQICEKK
jgi:hypothetical protein